MYQKRKIACKTTFVDWVWPGVPSHAETYLNLSGVTLVGWSVGIMATFKIIKNERFIEF